MTFKLDHIVLNVENIEEMITFYTKVLDLPAERLCEFRNKEVPFPSVRLTEESIIDLFPRELWEELQPDMVCRPNQNHFCLSTDKARWDWLLDRVKSYGISIDAGPAKRWGAYGTGISFYIQDPEKNVIEIRYYENLGASQPCLLTS
jgi:catechol 2,3-dioxygenase-like lactoylglutathione lyase family enzyme